MTRSLCILTGIILTLTPFVSREIGSGDDPDRRQLVQSIGGDPNMYAPQFRCDGGPNQSGGSGTVYVGCSPTQSTCTQCVIRAQDGSLSAAQYIAIKSLYGGGNSPGPMSYPNNPNQNCGNVLNGTCVVDNTSPSGYTCQGTLGGPCNPVGAVGNQPFYPPN
jgi:hypothetical protein